MEQELDQVVQAITIASDPAQATLHQQALHYLGTIQQNAENTWRLALPLFVDSAAGGGRKYSPEVRFFALRVLDEFFDNRFEPLDDETFRTIQQSLVAYIQSEYVYGPAEANSSFLRNKFSHTLTLFFLCTYMTPDQWPTFFPDLFSLIRPAQSSSSSSEPAAFNRHIILLFFHIVLEISGEVADQMLKSARTFNQARQTRDARVRDAVRERDAAGINEAVLTIVSEGAQTMKKGGASPRELEAAVEVVDLGIRTFGSYAGWIDINLTVTPTTVPLLFNLLADPSLPIRLATCVALTRIVSKGLKEPSDKLQLLKVLSLGQVIDALESKTRTEQLERKEADEGEESYREALGRLLNILGLELTKLVEEPTTDDITAEATVLVAQILPILLRFMADDYDDTCSTVFPLLHVILTGYKRTRKSSSEAIEETRRSFLTSLLQVILTKMKWDEETDMEDPDEEENAEFEALRRELRGLLDAIIAVDQELVTEAVRSLALNTIGAFQNGIVVKWNDAELGVYLVFIFGEINKIGVKGRPVFCQGGPPIERDKRKSVDYSAYPLTPHGEMLFTLIQSNISSYPHRSVTLQFFETIARYPDFFKVRRECIMPTLEAMIDTRGLHNSDASHRGRVNYLFHRFIKEVRHDIPGDVAVNIANSLRDLLPIEVQLSDAEDSDSSADLLTEAIKNSAFDSQLYLYETVGTLCSLLSKTPDQLAELLLSFVKPLMSELSDNLQAYRSKGAQDIVPIVKVHHDILALGNIAKGFPEYPTPTPAGYVPLPVDVFAEVAQAILVCLEAMNVFKDIRDASRSAFARTLATTGPNVTHLIPQLMANLLTQFEPPELVDFLNFIGLLIHKLQRDLFTVLDELIAPLSAHITGLLTQPVSGTDDQRVHVETKKAYLALLNNILASKLHPIFISERNSGRFDSLMESMLSIAGDLSDPPCQKAALLFLSRSVTTWGQPASTAPNGNGLNAEDKSLPGFEQYIYERILPTVFRVPSLPEFNLKDAAHGQVLHEIANLLQTVFKTRGTEANEYFLGVFLPAQGWPPETAQDFTSKLRELEGKPFRKYFTDFVRSSRSGS
ncbi:armadillo-type protein [Mycena alexandri]|uniref:Exportin-T n=1 Tax=Mycena alexandri TaxID=1745969 RepID=A0AAD6SWC9_9AGAR|nr:armadillo-type protein [Mycena alexandri]